MENENEIWSAVKDYEGLYRVSNLGNIVSCGRTVRSGRGGLHTYPFKSIKKSINNKGYIYVSLHKNSKQKNFFLHRLVAFAFIPNPDNLPQVNHKKGDKLDNRAFMLEWCTGSVNVLHAIENNLKSVQFGDNAANRKLNSKNVQEIKESLKTEGVSSVAKRFGVCHSLVSQIKSSKIWKSVSRI